MAASPPRPATLSSLRPSELEEFVKGVSFDLSDRELFCIEEQDVFDRVYSLIKGFASLTPACKFNLVEGLRSNLSVLIPNVDSLSRASQAAEDDEAPVLDRVASHRNAFKIYTFVLIHIVLIEESNISTNSSSKLAFTEKGMKKLMESFKTYEYVLSEDSVMDNFRNIVNKAKKFAKPELRSCTEEFEEKLVKFHVEKKQQERTAKNAQTHQQKLSSLENFVVTRNGEESEESEIVEDGTDEEITDPFMEGTAQFLHYVSKSKAELNKHSQASGEVTELEPCENEVQSLTIHQ